MSENCRPSPSVNELATCPLASPAFPMTVAIGSSTSILLAQEQVGYVGVNEAHAWESFKHCAFEIYKACLLHWNL